MCPFLLFDNYYMMAIAELQGPAHRCSILISISLSKRVYSVKIEIAWVLSFTSDTELLYVVRCTFTDVTFDKVRGSVFSPNQTTLIFFPSYDFLHDNEMAHRGIIPLLTISLISIPCQAKSIQNTDVFTKSIRMPNVRPQKVSKSKCCRHELCK